MVARRRKRSRFSKRRSYRRRRSSTRRRSSRRGSRGRKWSNNKVFCVKRTNVGVAEVPIASVYPNSLVFSLAMVPSYNLFSTLYDRYCISAVRLTFTWNFDNNDSMPGASNLINPGVPYFYWLVDYDDQALIVSPAAMLSAGAHFRRMNKPITIFIRCRAQRVIYENTSVVNAFGYEPARNVWVDCIDSSVPYYGLKYLIDPNPGGFYTGTATTAGILQAHTTFYLKFAQIQK